MNTSNGMFSLPLVPASFHTFCHVAYQAIWSVLACDFLI